VQFRKAASVWVEPLKRQLRNVQSENVPPRFDASVRSTPAKATAVWVCPERSSPSQS
jgi:hypothetical protein